MDSSTACPAAARSWQRRGRTARRATSSRSATRCGGADTSRARASSSARSAPRRATRSSGWRRRGVRPAPRARGRPPARRARDRGVSRPRGSPASSTASSRARRSSRCSRRRGSCRPQAERPSRREAATADDAKLLGVKRGAPLLVERQADPRPGRRAARADREPVRRRAVRPRRRLRGGAPRVTGRRIDELKAGVVGTGFIGAVHVDALRRLGVEVTGVVGSTPERAEAKRLAPVYESYEALLADERVDVVHLTTPNNLHHPQVKAGARGGQARRLREAARADRRRVRRAARARRAQRPRALHELQHPLLPDGAGGARARASDARRDLERARRVPAGLASATRPTGTGGSSRREAARCVRSATSARTGSTSFSS